LNLKIKKKHVNRKYIIRKSEKRIELC